jgi:hypothetical protein
MLIRSILFTCNPKMQLFDCLMLRFLGVTEFAYRTVAVICTDCTCMGSPAPETNVSSLPEKFKMSNRIESWQLAYDAHYVRQIQVVVLSREYV